MPELVSAIQSMHKKREFRQLPLGPLGKYIEVVDQKFRGPVEAILQSKMLSFCVDNGKDREVLSRLLSKTASRYPEARRCTIITTKFVDRVYDVSGGKVESVAGAHCTLDVIRCTNPVVANILIDHCKIERILIAEDQNVAFNVTSNVENVPQNLMKVMVVNPPTEMFPAPNLRTYALKKMQPRYLQVNMEQRKQ